MKSKLLDCTKLECPMPVIKAKQELEKDGEMLLEVLVDNEIAVQNLTKLATSMGFKSSSKTQGDNFTVSIEKTSTPSLNQAWLVVRVEHQGYQSGILEEDAVERNSSDSHLAINPASRQEGNRYENRLLLIPHNKPWRSPLKPRPILSVTLQEKLPHKV